MTKKLIVEGMSCQHCVNHVKEALSELESVESVEVNLNAKTVLVNCKDNVDDNKMKLAIEDAGYELVNISTL